MSWGSWSTLWGFALQPLIADCVYFADSDADSLTDLATDQSQFATNLTVGAGGLTEATSVPVTLTR